MKVKNSICLVSTYRHVDAQAVIISMTNAEVKEQNNTPHFLTHTKKGKAILLYFFYINLRFFAFLQPTPTLHTRDTLASLLRKDMPFRQEQYEHLE